MGDEAGGFDGDVPGHAAAGGDEFFGPGDGDFVEVVVARLAEAPLFAEVAELVNAGAAREQTALGETPNLAARKATHLQAQPSIQNDGPGRLP